MPTSVAPLISGWQRRVGGMPGPYSVAPASGAASGGTGPNGLLVELLVDGSWVDITNRVMVRDSSGQITIRRGRTSESSGTDPGACSLTLNNRDGLFSPANPVSPYYGKIGRNTQIRVSVRKGDDKSYRFWGEVPAWPEDWDTTDQDVWVDIEAAGILQRLNQGRTPLSSTLRRRIPTATNVFDYWPMEDGASATQAASGLPGGTAMTVSGLNFAADSTLAGSSPLPQVSPPSTMTARARVRPVGDWHVEMVYRLDSLPAAPTLLLTVNLAGGTASQIQFSVGVGVARIQALDSTGAVIGTSDFTPDNFTGDWGRLQIETQTSGGTVNFFGVWIPNVAGSAYVGATYSGTPGRITSVTGAWGTAFSTLRLGHLAFFTGTTTSIYQDAITGFAGEGATSRIVRLCREENVDVTTFVGDTHDPMGPQLPLQFLALLQECVDVDQGVLMEREVSFGLAYRPRGGMYNQKSSLNLSYPLNQLAAVPKPVPDDQNTRNDITASRPGGSSAQVTQNEGPLSTLPPPLGVGSYQDTPTLNVSTDGRLLQHAAWRVHLGTVDEPRYPAISVNLAHPSMAAQRLFALNVFFGNRIVINNPPGRLGGNISQIVIGIQETITHFEHRITYVCAPETPYRVATLEDPTYGQLDTGGSALAGDMTPDSTTVAVATTTGTALWTPDPADTPFSITVTGEEMRVDAVGTLIHPNPFLDTDSSGWTGQAATADWSNAQLHPYGATGALLITPDGVTASGGVLSAHSPVGSVTPGAQYTASLWVFSPGGWADLRPAVDWWDASDTFLSSSLPSPTSVPAGQWTFLKAIVTAPASASRAVMRGRHGSTPSAMNVWFAWALRLTPVVPLASPQQFTVTRSRNGVVKTHQASEDVRLTHPMTLAL